MNNVEASLRQKRFISLDGGRGRSVCFEFNSLDIENQGRAMDVSDLISRYENIKECDVSEVRRLTVEFVSHYSPTYHSEKIKDYKKLNFEVFIDTVYNRLSGLARQHCGFNGKEPDSNRFLDSLHADFSTRHHKNFQYIRAWAKKIIEWKTR